MLRTVKAQGFAHIIYREYPEASVGVPIFSNGVARACLLMGYVKTEIKPSQVRSEYVPMLQALAAEIQGLVRSGLRAVPAGDRGGRGAGERSRKAASDIPAGVGGGRRAT